MIQFRTRAEDDIQLHQTQRCINSLNPNKVNRSEAAPLTLIKLHVSLSVPAIQT